MKEILAKNISLISKLGIVVVILTSIFLFWNLTTDLYDTPKFLVLLIVTGALLVLLTIRFIFNGRVTLIRTPLDIPLVLFLSVAVVSTVLSSSPYVALLGNQLKVHGSLVAIVVYILFYFVLVNSLKTVKEVNWILFIVTLAGVGLSIITLLAYSGLTLLPPPWVHGVNFTPTGSSFSTTALLILLIPFLISQAITSTKPQSLLITSAFLTLFGITIALTGSIASWITAVAAFLITALCYRIQDHIKVYNLKKLESQFVLISLAVPLVIVVLVSVLSLIPPMGGAQNPLYAQAQKFPREAQLSFANSWKISVSSFRDAPFWGSGPGTFIFDFTNYKPVEYNSSKLWNVRFDTGFNEYLSVLATLGGVGLLALLSLTALFISFSAATLIQAYKSRLDDLKSPSQSIKIALAVSGLVFFALLALHPSTLVLWVFGLFVLASFMILKDPSEESLFNPHHSQSGLKDTLLRIAGNVGPSGSSSQTLKIEALPSILLVVTVALVLGSFFFGAKFALADFHHRKALNAIAANQGIEAYNELITAEKLNPYADSYRTDLAQTNFALANAIASAKGPTEASPSGSLTDQDKQNIQVLLQQSINEARVATTLSPRSALNWEILGLLYRQIAGVAQNALVFSLDSYGKAIFQDPLNPNLRLSVGGVYYAIANYDLAIRFFTDSINLKPDFANAYYNLSVALKDKGDLTNAKLAAEKILTLVPADSPDYKTASDYLADLNKRIEQGTAEKSPTTPPASETTGALKDQTLPKVVDVGTPPEKIATPAAVVKPSPTPEATTSNSPTPSPTTTP